ncbi:hypothetical protein HELRODRAFT_181005 [Helobdella robusta]|uniref:Uncharacterized protein n=1 Tax=Helobdella robusta TaxID=6412 RepID=T1FGI5_HELRO|nr:hypothetical protein HELRODRAFT_181005 [Helobdella robusta]ESN93461.1 hypothetical protein HELRODRAFT_181005 [Helobdella robusta]
MCIREVFFSIFVHSHIKSYCTLIPRANGWLQNNLDIYLIKCETVEKKVTCIEDVTNDSCMFLPKNHHAAYVKGLRLWYVNVTGTRKLALESMAPSEIGYMNVIPKCIDASGKYPKYEHLPETYAAINAYLAGAPLEGKIVTIETVPLKLPRKQWKSFEINPDETYFPDEYLRHVLNITRIYFRYGEPEVELIGAQDFLPDFEGSSHWPPLHHSTPRYGPISTAINKVKDWIQNTNVCIWVWYISLITQVDPHVYSAH